MRWFWILGLILASALAKAQNSQAHTISNLQTIIGQNHFAQVYALTPVQRVKIAVFDNGFKDYKNSIGHGLPTDTHFVGTPESSDSSHGRMMAELIYSLMSNQDYAPQFGPEIYLYRVPTFTEFKNAISDCLKNGVQIISYSDVLDFGSNWEGGGFWNKEVNRATSSGIIWVNAAGNLARRTFNASINFRDHTGEVLLPDDTTLTLTCQSRCPVHIVLSWNDFKNDITLGTTKDLDLYIADDKGHLLSSTLTQVKGFSAGKLSESGKTLYPQEHIDTILDKGDYSISVHAKNPEAFGLNDKLRLTVDGPSVILSHYDIGESLLNPADNPNVVTVGATDSDQTAVSVSLHKPELLTPSEFNYDGQEYKGSSISAAIVSAGFGLLKELKPDLNRSELLSATGDFTYSSMNAVFELRQLH